MLRIWGRRNSGNVQKVMWLVGELGLAHEHVPAGGPFGGLDSREFAARNPNRLIPVIEDDRGVVWESHAILRYLAARHGAPEYWADDPFERSLADRWIDWAATTWQPAFMTGVFWGFWRTPEPQRDMAAVGRAVGACAELLRMLDKVLAEQPFLAGGRLTLADIPVGAMMHRYFGLPIERPRLTHVEAWYDRLRERPAWREHVGMPFDDLKGRLSF